MLITDRHAVRTGVTGYKAKVTSYNANGLLLISGLFACVFNHIMHYAFPSALVWPMALKKWKLVDEMKKWT